MFSLSPAGMQYTEDFLGFTSPCAVSRPVDIFSSWFHNPSMNLSTPDLSAVHPTAPRFIFTSTGLVTAASSAYIHVDVDQIA